MKLFRADMHIHTLLSPCGDLEMSPANIIACAKKKNLDIIGITDHNSTLHCGIMQKLGNDNGIFVLSGAEVTTREEIHCLAFFEDPSSLEAFQNYLDQHLPFIPNNPKFFGYQVIIDENENILKEIKNLLSVALDQSIEQVQTKIKELKGIFIPAHVDRFRFSILSQLGFFPDTLNPDAIEYTGHSNPELFREMHPEFNQYTLLLNSDAHDPMQIGEKSSLFLLEDLSFQEIRWALHNLNGRKVMVA